MWTPKVKKFDGRKDFNLWRENMITHLEKLGLDEALKGESKMPDTIENKGEILKKARNTIILNLSDHILWKVVNEKSACEIWNKLEQLYMTKALPNRIHLKQRFYSFKMDENKTIDENINEFTKLLSDLKTIEVKIDEEDQAIFLLNSLPKAYEQLRDTLIYGRDTLTLEKVTSAAYSKELDLRAAGKHYKPAGEGLNVRARSFEREENDNEGRNQSKSSSSSKKTCWICKNEGHIRRNCPQSKVMKGIFGEREKLKETNEYKRAMEEEWASRQQELKIQAEEAQHLRQLQKRRQAENGSTMDSVESCIIGEREKFKETDEYKRAMEEEWACRLQALKIQAEEVQHLRRLQRRIKAENMRKLDMERRQKERIEEMRSTQKKDEENKKLKEVIRAEVRKELSKLEPACQNMASLLHSFGIQIEGWPNPSPQKVQAAYKRALLTFHPDRALLSDIRQQVEAEEKFKLMNRFKDKFSSVL